MTCDVWRVTGIGFYPIMRQTLFGLEGDVTRDLLRLIQKIIKRHATCDFHSRFLPNDIRR